MGSSDKLEFRDQLILRLVLKGKSTQEIADVFGVGKKYMHSILNRLRKHFGAKNYMAAAKEAERLNLL